MSTRPPKTYQDLQAVTGLGRDTVKAAILAGELPGYKIGKRYVVPADAFDAFCAGTWEANPRLVIPKPLTVIGSDAMLKRRVS